MSAPRSPFFGAQTNHDGSTTTVWLVDDTGRSVKLQFSLARLRDAEKGFAAQSAVAGKRAATPIHPDTLGPRMNVSPPPILAMRFGYKDEP